MKNILLLLVIFCSLPLAGCALPQNGGAPSSTMLSSHLSEPAWIHNGEPIIFESETWFPIDEVENLLDSEIYEAGTYRDVIFYIERSDIRPFGRIYTYFAKNRYRAFER
jgi:hypothetical protein